MKLPLLIPSAVLALSLPLLAADAPAAPAPAPAAPDFSADKTPDDFWKHLEALQQQPKEKPATREEALAQVSKWFATQQMGADAFVKAFPQDPRSWQARMMSYRASFQLRRFGGAAGSPEADRQKLDEVINAPEAPATVKGEATFMKVLTLTSDLRSKKPEAFAAFNAAAADFLVKFPDHPLAGQMKTIQLQVLGEDETAEGKAILEKLATGADPRQAEAAKTILERRDKQAKLKSAPMDLKFTATDGQPVDLANLRGKVVLVDFWASWCGPCIAEMPNVVATYQKLHAKGFEIVGISLDQEKGAMEAALKKQGMTWSQYFDGGGWDNKIAKSFDITSIPAALLLDKKGVLRETGLRGEELGAAIEKLLAE